jgi:hypothetical protein
MFYWATIDQSEICSTVALFGPQDFTILIKCAWGKKWQDVYLNDSNFGSGVVAAYPKVRPTEYWQAVESIFKKTPRSTLQTGR